MQHGLISRTIDDDGSDMVLVTEVWDHTNPKCPVIIFDKTVRPWVKRADIVEVTHRFRVRRLNVSAAELDKGAE